MTVNEVLETREKYKLLRRMRGERYYWHFLWEQHYAKAPHPVALMAPNIPTSEVPGIVHPESTIDEDNILDRIPEHFHSVAFAYFSTSTAFSEAASRLDYRYELFWLAHKLLPRTLQLWTSDASNINIFSIKPLLTVLNVSSII